MPPASLSMHDGTVPPAGVGLFAGLLTAAGAIALTARGLLPLWVTTPLLLLVGGLAAGLAAPVRPTIGALLGAVTGVFAAIFLTIVLLSQWTPVPDQYLTPPPFVLITGAFAIVFTPVYAVAGAVGAAVRPRLVARRPAAGERARGLTPEGRQWLGIAAGALLIIVASQTLTLVAPSSLAAVFLVSAFAGGLVAGILSRGGARSGLESGLLSAVFGLGVIALYFIGQASTATGDGVPEGLWPIAIAIMGFWVLPAALLGGALGGSFRKPPGPSDSPDDQGRDEEGRVDSEPQ